MWIPTLNFNVIDFQKFAKMSNEKGLFEQAKEGIQNMTEKTKEKATELKEKIVGEKSTEDKAADKVKDAVDKTAEKVTDVKDCSREQMNKLGQKIEDMGNNMQASH